MKTYSQLMEAVGHTYHPPKETTSMKEPIPAYHEFSTAKHLITIHEPSNTHYMDIHVWDKKRQQTLYSEFYKNGHGKPWGLWTQKGSNIINFSKHGVPKSEVKSVFKKIKKHVEKHIGGTISDDPAHHDIWDTDGSNY